jgi:hypothetical protein
MPNPLTGLMFCHDCGGKMYYHSSNKPRHYLSVSGEEKTRLIKAIYKCSSQSLSRQKFNPECSPHVIQEKVVLEILQEVLRKTTSFVSENEAEFVQMLREKSVVKQGTTVKSHQKEIAKNERRISEIDKLFNSLYEDKVKGLLTDERFAIITQNFEREQSELKQKNNELKAEVEAFETDSKNSEKFVNLVKKFTNFEELTPQIINEFVERIEVHEGEYPDAEPSIGYKGERVQKVDIFLKYIGNVEELKLYEKTVTFEPKLTLSEKTEIQIKREKHRIAERERRARRRAEKVAAAKAKQEV